MVVRNQFKICTEIYSAIATNVPVVFYGSDHPPQNYALRPQGIQKVLYDVECRERYADHGNNSDVVYAKPAIPGQKDVTKQKIQQMVNPFGNENRGVRGRAIKDAV